MTTSHADGEIRVAADDQPLAGKIGCGDAGHVALVEQRELQGARLQQRLDRRRAQGGDPVQAGGWAPRFEYGLKAVAWLVVAATIVAKGNQDALVRVTGALMAVTVVFWITALFVAELRGIEARLIGRAAKRNW